MSLRFATQYSPNKIRLEVNSGKRMVESSGYIPPKVQIENMILAGKRLTDYRHEMYDFDNEQKDDGVTVDPVRSPNFDMADAFQMEREAKERINERRSRKKDRAGNEDVPAAGAASPQTGGVPEEDGKTSV